MSDYWIEEIRARLQNGEHEYAVGGECRYCGEHISQSGACDKSKSGEAYLLAVLDVAKAALKAVPTWQPIETAPKYDYAHGRLILRVPRDVDEFPPRYIAVLGYRDGDTWHDECGTLSPTHWMPLPPTEVR